MPELSLELRFWRLTEVYPSYVFFYNEVGVLIDYD